MSAYIIIRVEVSDPSLLKSYQTATPPIIEKYQGKFLVRGGETLTLEGPKEHRRLVILEFPDLQTAKEFYHSPEYAEAHKLREGLAKFELIAVEGI